MGVPPGNKESSPCLGGGTADRGEEKLLLCHPSVQTTCSGSYWCTVVCTLVRLCTEGLQSCRTLEAGVWTKLCDFPARNV
ncbi:hypothetical protein GN956_G6291 [Arapaima gigas]